MGCQCGKSTTVEVGLRGLSRSKFKTDSACFAKVTKAAKTLRGTCCKMVSWGVDYYFSIQNIGRSQKEHVQITSDRCCTSIVHKILDCRCHRLQYQARRRLAALAEACWSKVSCFQNICQFHSSCVNWRYSTIFNLHSLGELNFVALQVDWMCVCVHVE